MPNKIDLVNGAYQLIRISGLTSVAIPSEVKMALQVADDLAGELSADLDLGYIQPLAYGDSDPNDYSGLTNQTAGAFKKLLARELVDYFGKAIPISLHTNAERGMRSLEQILVNVMPSQNPATLPIGSGNERDYRNDKFYQEPTSDDGAISHNLTDVFQLPIEWASWLAGLFDLVSVEYEADAGITLANSVITGTMSVTTVSFSQKGQFTLCAKATNSNGDVQSERIVYNVTDCNKTYYP